MFKQLLLLNFLPPLHLLSSPAVIVIPSLPRRPFLSAAFSHCLPMSSARSRLLSALTGCYFNISCNAAATCLPSVCASASCSSAPVFSLIALVYCWVRRLHLSSRHWPQPLVAHCLYSCAFHLLQEVVAWTHYLYVNERSHPSSPAGARTSGTWCTHLASN